MAIDRKLLDILCCPVTGVPLEPLTRDGLARLNALIRQGQARYVSDEPVEAPLTEALITTNGERVYRVDDSIPVMLDERAIPGRLLRDD